ETQESIATIKSEARRLMIEKIVVSAGEKTTCEFVVNTRTPELPGGGSVGLKKGEETSPRWDDQLSLEFNGSNLILSQLEITPAPKAITLFIASDSTATEQNNEPWTGWGQMLSGFFDSNVAISNHAQSGLALFSFYSQRRLVKILSMLKPGDYVFIQFGHNDQKDKSENAGPFTTYTANLKKFIGEIREKGGQPVLVSPMERRRWSGGKPRPTLADYAEAVRKVGEEEKVPVIDLNAMSLTLYEAFGESNSAKLFVHYPAHTFPGQEKKLKDNTHHNAFGAYELAKCMAEGIREKLPELAAHLRKDLPPFDPAHPDDPDKFAIPATPGVDIEKPDGN
ncbi:MAG: rhamnogalacturonan acetylesterase, partial [Chthoniobacterales bacterium]